MHFRNLRPRSRRGFTLVEILIVVAIIGLLVGLGVANLDSIFQGARIDTAKMFVDTGLSTSMMSYQRSMGSYPTTAEGLQALLSAPSNARAGAWRGPYVKKLPEDPWGEPYQYVYPGVRNKNGYDLWSKGPDKENGTADDIGNWPDAQPQQQ